MMNPDTSDHLNQINRDFYHITAGEFDQTRARPWPGWERLLPYLETPLSALDVGCGNGRFGVFLQDHLVGGDDDVSIPALLHYHGLDNNPTLLDRARDTLTRLPGIAATFDQRDLVEQPPDCGHYDLVACCGLLHHIPGNSNRLDFLRCLAERVAPGGYLVFACWRFYEYERFRDRIVPWDDDLVGQVEPHDYLLDWRRGDRALRYCHYVDDDEHARLVSATDMTEIAAYRADGFTGAVNRYSLLRKGSGGR
jgi:SAM-dependent methyltransferase